MDAAFDVATDTITEATTTDASSDVNADAPSLSDSSVQCDAQQTFYLDSDHDNYGGTTTKSACTPPTNDWVTMGGDCDDGNAEVHPNQNNFYSVGYVPTGKMSTSFDYDCDGIETESGKSAKANCQTVNLACVGDGYLPALPSRMGGGVDPYCGSTMIVGCSFINLVCKAGPPSVASAISCR